MGTLYVGFDFFCPGAFVPAAPLPGAETYPHEANSVFGILQAALTTDPGTDPLLPRDYFRLTGPDLANHNVVFVTDALGPDILSRIKASAIPVPFPPDTSLSAHWQQSGGSAVIDISRTIPSAQMNPAEGLTSPLLLPVTDWPVFAEANFATPHIRAYAHIAGVRPERRAGIENDLMSWAISLATRIIHEHRNPPAPPTPAETAAYAILAPLDQALGSADAPTPQTDDMIRAFLQAPSATGGMPRAGELWEAMLAASAAGDPILPPRFLHDMVSLSSETVLKMDLGDPLNPPWAVSYHHKVWKDLCQQVANQPEIAQGLGRLYAFGERLRWPLGVEGDPAFMVVDESASRGTARNWLAFGTNVHSLLGQVFRLPLAMGDDISQAGLHFEVQGVQSPEVARALRTLLADATTPRAQTATIGRDADRAAGFFLFAPKMAQMTAGPAPAGSATPFTTPSSLLDAVDTKPRWSAPAGGPGLSVRLPQRIALRETELYRPDLAGSSAARRLALPARLLQLPNTFQAASTLFELVVAGTLHDDEAEEVISRFLQLRSSGGQLWMTVSAAPGVAAWDLAGQVLDASQVPGRGLVATIVDRPGPGNLLKDLVAQVSSPVPGGKDGLTLHGVTVDVLMPPPGYENALFNRVLGGLVAPPGTAERPPLCILRGAFTSKVSACTDRILDRFELTYSPSPTGAAGAQPVIRQFGDFNKVRLALSSYAPQVTTRAPGALTNGRWVDFLNYPDAVVPMPVNGYTPLALPWLTAAPPGTTARHFGYFLSQVFTQDARVDDKSDPKQRLAAESLRYINYLTPEVAWRLEGHAEHQYTFRFPLNGADIALPLAADIHNPASAAQRAAGHDAALVNWNFVPSAAALELSFLREYLTRVIAVASGGNPRPAALRAIYEPLADLMAAIDRGIAELRLERWTFSPEGPSRSGPDPDESGALSANMRLSATHRRPLKPGDAALAPLSAIRNLLNRPLEDFETTVKALAQGAGDNWLKLTIPLGSGWSDLSNPGIISAESDVLRLGFDLTRAAASVIPSGFADPARPAMTPGFGLPVDGDQLKTYPELANENFAALHDPAATELGNYVSAAAPTSLRQRFDWIRAQRPPAPVPVPAQETDPERVTDPRRFERLFGETATFLIAPPDARPPVDRVVDVYYVPFGFLPLRPHPKIGDSETTLEFAEFLARLLDDLCSGRDPQDMKVQPLAATDAYAVRSGVTTALLPAVAHLMSELILYVHNPDSNPLPDALLSHVHQLTTASMASIRGTVRSIFAATPGLFSTSKGFGIALFEPDSWSDRLHSLQLRIQIHPAARPEGLASDPSRFDVHQTAFPRFQNNAGQRFAVDVLDDKRYDNEFEIDQCVFDPARPAWVPGHGVDLSIRRLRQRGDLQARTGEDVIEQRHRFDDGILGRRQLECDAVHWNPNWTVSAPNVSRQFYLLPSRRRPATPVKLKPRPGTVPPRCNLPLVLASPTDRPQLNAQLSATITARLNRNNSADFGTSGQNDLSAVRLNPVVAGQIQPPRGAGQLAAPGWWRLETYASEHYFLVEADEEATGPDGPFNNDRFRVEVDLGEQPFADEDPSPPQKFAVEGELGAWFTYQRLKAADPTGTISEPTPVTRQGLETELRQWLAPPDPGDGLLVAAPPVPQAALSPGTQETKVTWFSPGLPSDGRLRSVAPQSVGSILAAEIMQLKTDKPSPDRFVLKIMVLDEPWRYTRVRVRTERNLRDVNDDGVPDINSAFQMFGDFSSWSSHGREEVQLDFQDMQTRHFPARLATITPAPTLNKFLTCSQTDQLDYGDQVGAALDATFTDSTGATQSFWDTDRARCRRYLVKGMIIQRRPDLHPRYAQAELTDQLDSRTEDIPRLHLAPFAPDTDASLRDFSPLLTGITKAEVPSPHHSVRVTWSNPDGGNVLTSTWPVRFNP